MGGFNWGLSAVPQAPRPEMGSQGGIMQPPYGASPYPQNAFAQGAAALGQVFQQFAQQRQQQKQQDQQDFDTFTYLASRGLNIDQKKYQQLGKKLYGKYIDFNNPMPQQQQPQQQASPESQLAMPPPQVPGMPGVQMGQQGPQPYGTPPPPPQGMPQGGPPPPMQGGGAPGQMPVLNHPAVTPPFMPGMGPGSMPQPWYRRLGNGMAGIMGLPQQQSPVNPQSAGAQAVNQMAQAGRAQYQMQQQMTAAQYQKAMMDFRLDQMKSGAFFVSTTGLDPTTMTPVSEQSRRQAAQMTEQIIDRERGNPDSVYGYLRRAETAMGNNSPEFSAIRNRLLWKETGGPEEQAASDRIRQEYKGYGLTGSELESTVRAVIGKSQLPPTLINRIPEEVKQKRLDDYAKLIDKYSVEYQTKLSSGERDSIASKFMAGLEGDAVRELTLHNLRPNDALNLDVSRGNLSVAQSNAATSAYNAATNRGQLNLATTGQEIGRVRGVLDALRTKKEMGTLTDGDKQVFRDQIINLAGKGIIAKDVANWILPGAAYGVAPGGVNKDLTDMAAGGSLTPAAKQGEDWTQALMRAAQFFGTATAQNTVKAVNEFK